MHSPPTFDVGGLPAAATREEAILGAGVSSPTMHPPPAVDVGGSPVAVRRLFSGQEMCRLLPLRGWQPRRRLMLMGRGTATPPPSPVGGHPRCLVSATPSRQSSRHDAGIDGAAGMDEDEDTMAKAMRHKEEANLDTPGITSNSKSFMFLATQLFQLS
jgi:hypothetical protein